jgi:hypothetical protein
MMASPINEAFIIVLPDELNFSLPAEPTISKHPRRNKAVATTPLQPSKTVMIPCTIVPTSECTLVLMDTWRWANAIPFKLQRTSADADLTKRDIKPFYHILGKN